MVHDYNHAFGHMNIHEEKWNHSRTNTVQRMNIHIPDNIITNETKHTKHIRSIFNSSTEVVKQWSHHQIRCAVFLVVGQLSMILAVVECVQMQVIITMEIIDRHQNSEFWLSQTAALWSGSIRTYYNRADWGVSVRIAETLVVSVDGRWSWFHCYR